VLTPGDVSQDHGLFAIVDAGIYTIEVNDALNCGPVTTDEITILDVTGILDYVFADALVYPNPSTGQITIEMTVHSQETLLEVMGLTGQVVKSEMIYHYGGKIRQNIDLQNLSKGMYMLRVDGKMLRSPSMLVRSGRNDILTRRKAANMRCGPLPRAPTGQAIAQRIPTAVGNQCLIETDDFEGIRDTGQGKIDLVLVGRLLHAKITFSE
jgi:hypothetical protein